MAEGGLDVRAADLLERLQVSKLAEPTVTAQMLVGGPAEVRRPPPPPPPALGRLGLPAARGGAPQPT